MTYEAWRISYQSDAQAARAAYAECVRLQAKVEEMKGRPPYGAIAKILTEVMDIATANGADSRSMPDEYVEVAAWLCGVPGAQPAPSEGSITAGSLSGMFLSLDGHDKAQPGYEWRKGWNDAIRQAMDYAQPTPSVPEGWRLVPTAESRHPGIYKMLGALHTVDNTPGASEWESYAAFLAAAPEAKP